MDNFAYIILKSLITNKEYASKVINFLEKEYFLDYSTQKIFVVIKQFIEKYNDIPTYEALIVLIGKIKGIPEDKYKEIIELLESLRNFDEQSNLDFLLDNTEKFCKDQAIHNAVRDSIGIIDGESDKERGEIPELLKTALSVSFDTNIGHDYLEEAGERWDMYNTKDDKLSFGMRTMDKITNGGLGAGTLNLFIGATHGGKTLMMTNFAANHLKLGKNVLFISMEMSEAEIAKRIDCVLLDITQPELETITKHDFTSKVKNLSQKTNGKLKIKQFPSGAGHVGHFRHLLNEYKLKKDFIPDIIYIDYINICASSRLKASSVGDSYLYIKTICEELRGLAIEQKIPIISASQLNRQGIKSENVSMSDVSDSIGTSFTADFMLGIIRTEEFDKEGKILCTQMKNRYKNLADFKSFFVDCDFTKFRITDSVHSDYNEIINTKTKTEQSQPFKPKESKFNNVKF